MFIRWNILLVLVLVGSLFPPGLLQGQDNLEPKETELERQKRSIDELFEKCSTLWIYEPFSSKKDLKERYRFDYLQPDWKLSPKEKDCILEMSDLLIRKENILRNYRRDNSAKFLGMMGHSYGLPALLAVLRDKEDNRETRFSCVTALGRITDKQVIAPLIDLLAEKGIGVGAHEQLLFLTHVGIGVNEDWRSTESNSKERKHLQDRWRIWWKENKDKVTLDREAARWSDPSYKIIKDEDIEK